MVCGEGKRDENMRSLGLKGYSSWEEFEGRIWELGFGKWRLGIEGVLWWRVRKKWSMGGSGGRKEIVERTH
jgi:hypothetical protein